MGRGLRWYDLRRFSTDLVLAKTLARKAGSVTYVLPPGDPRYAYLIPSAVIQTNGMAQNKR